MQARQEGGGEPFHHCTGKICLRFATAIFPVNLGVGLLKNFALANLLPEMTNQSPATVVQAQLDAYNAKDIEALLNTYAPDAEQFTLHGERLAVGHEQMRPRFLGRFSEPDLQARLLSRTVVGNIVTDFEVITRNFPEGRGTLEMLCIYEVLNGLIQRASFSLGEKTLHATV